MTAAFDGGRITSDGGVILLAAAERRLGICRKLAAEIADRRDPDRVVHLLPDILRARILAIACGFEDADDLDRLRTDPAFKLACDRLPDSGRDFCSQPTVSRWENAPSLRELIRLMGVLVDLYCTSYATAPNAVTLDIDDTVDVVHGHQQLSLFNAHYDERCFLPIHVYDTATSRPVTVILGPGKTPAGKEIRGHLRRLIRRIRRHWPATRITIRGDGHYGRPEIMAWCDDNAIDYVFGLPGNATLDRAVDDAADDVRTRRALDQKLCLRGFAESAIRPNPGTRAAAFAPAPKPRPRASTSALSSPAGPKAPPSISTRRSLYCARGQAENLIKLHKSQLASDRTSCRRPLANQMRLVLHTAAYWLILAIRDAIPHTHALATVEFTTLRLRLLKLGVRIIETAARVRIAFAAACPEADLFRQIATGLIPAGP